MLALLFGVQTLLIQHVDTPCLGTPPLGSVSSSMQVPCLVTLFSWVSVFCLWISHLSKQRMLCF